MTWEVRFSRATLKHLESCKRSGLTEKARALLDILRINPFQTPPPCEKLKGLDDVYSRRINVQHRLVYHVDAENRRVKILSLWTHYE